MTLSLSLACSDPQHYIIGSKSLQKQDSYEYKQVQSTPVGRRLDTRLFDTVSNYLYANDQLNKKVWLYLLRVMCQCYVPKKITPQVKIYCG